MTRDEAMRQIAALGRESWLSRHEGASETDYRAAGMMAAIGMSDADWRGSSDAEAALARRVNAILAQIEE